MEDGVEGELNIPEAQAELQAKTDRNRTLQEYSTILGVRRLAGKEQDPTWATEGLIKLLEDTIRNNGSAVWVDLGCGNGVALRQAKVALKEKGVDISKLRTIGIDLLPVDTNDLRSHIETYPNLYQDGLDSDEYAPEFIQGDMSSVRFPEEADIVTGVETLQWTNDPLAVIGNANKQLKINGVIGLNRTNNILYTDNPSASTDPGQMLVESQGPFFHHLFTKETGFYEDIEGFDTLDQGTSSVLLRKKSDKDYSQDYRLVTRGKWLQGFQYLYTNAVNEPIQP
jgi:hypothetical protein